MHIHPIRYDTRGFLLKAGKNAGGHSHFHHGVTVT
jgi:hypothetical protein